MAWFYTIGMIFALASGAAWWQASSPFWAAASGLMATALGVKAWSEFRPSPEDDSLKLTAPKDLPEGLLPERFDKAVADYNTIHRALPKIRDDEIRHGFRALQHTARSLLVFLEDHPERLPQARRFIDYYQEQAVLLVTRYQEMEAAGLDSEAFRETSDRLRTGLRELSDAYRDQLARLFDDDLSAMDADLKVMRQMMDADGIKRDDGPADADSGPADASEAFRPHRTKPEEAPAPGPARRGIFAYEEELRQARRQKVIAGALGIFLGAFGAHKFYFGKTKWGFFYALLCWTGISGFLGFVEGLRFLFMPLDDFYEKYYKGSGN